MTISVTHPPYVLLSASNQPYYIKDSNYADDPYWISGPLNVSDFKDKHCTLRCFTVEYFHYSAATFDMYFSGDGGQNWSSAFQISDSVAAITTAWQTVYPDVSGPDLRVKMEFGNSLYNIIVIAFEPEIILRGDGAVS